MRRWQCEDTDMQRKRSCDDKGINWCYIAASKEHQGLLTNHQRKGKISPQVSEGAWPCQHLVWIFRLQNCEVINFCCFKPLGLWYFATVALGNKDSVYSEILRNQVETRLCKSSMFLKDLQILSGVLYP